MKKGIIFGILILLILPSLLAYTPDTVILGPGDGPLYTPMTDMNQLSPWGSGANDQYTWKVFKWRAGKNGEAYVFGLDMLDVTGGYEISDAQFAVWEGDESSTVGALKVWGYETGHRFDENTREYFDFNMVVTDRTIVQGNYYWIGWRSFLGNDDNHFRRATENDGTAYCPTGTGTCTKLQNEFDHGEVDAGNRPVTYTPPTSNFASGYGDNFYGWAIWNASDIPSTDTHLIGWDYYGLPYNDEACFYYPADSLNAHMWKASRVQAIDSGTLSYFKITALDNPVGCTYDNLTWAIYEGGTSSSVGALKAWGHYPTYNWVANGGAGEHDFPYTNVETDLNVDQGTYYWIVVESEALDRDYYANAGCSAQIAGQRGRDTTSCTHIPNGQYMVGQAAKSPPPPPSSYTSTHNSYFAWSIWGGSGGGGPVCPDGNCEAGENCQADASSCTDNQCYEPTCVNGCGQTLVGARGTDESCSGGNFCDGSGNCVECIDNNDCATQEVCNIDVCESGYHEADIVPPYGEIETGELTAYVDRWYHESTITIRDVVQVMRYWKAGSY